MRSILGSRKLIKLGVLVLAASAAVIPAGLWVGAASADSTTSVWYRQPGSPSVGVDVVCSIHEKQHSNDHGVAIVYANIWRTLPLQYAQRYAYRSWVQDGAGTWHPDAWHYGTIAAGTYNAPQRTTWTVAVVGPRITTGIWAGDTKAHAAVEASVVSGGAWHSVGLNVTSYGADGFSQYFPDCYI